MKSARVLNLGCGQRKIDGAVNIDKNKSSGADVVHDLNIFPYPFKANTFSSVICQDVLEHLEDIMSVMQELYRVCKSGATVSIESPHFSYVNAYADPTHRHYFSLFSFDYFTGENQWGYYLEDSFKFKTIGRKLIFQKTLTKKLFEAIFNRHPRFYESKLSWIYPAEKISIELEVVKAH